MHIMTTRGAFKFWLIGEECLWAAVSFLLMTLTHLKKSDRIPVLRRNHKNKNDPKFTDGALQKSEPCLSRKEVISRTPRILHSWKLLQ